MSMTAAIQTAFGLVELHWGDQRTLIALRLMPTPPSKSYEPLIDVLSPLADAITNYFDGASVDFRPFLSLWDSAATTDFRRRVYEHVATIPYGQLRSYSDVADAIGSPRSMRAVGGAMAANPIPLIVPCHRVVATTGIGGFSAGFGIALKRRMLELEDPANIQLEGRGSVFKP